MGLIHMIYDAKGNPVQVVPLKDSQDVDGTLVSAQSAVINGNMIRILSLDNILRVLIGANPTAVATSIAIPATGELWLPITPGLKVAVLGGIANITTAGV